MEFTKFDMSIILVMSIAIVSMAIVLPALGLTSASADENQIPELNITADRFNFAGEFPEDPGTPTTGNLTWDNNETFKDNSVWLHGDTDGGVQVVLIPNNNIADPPEIRYAEWSSGSEVDNESVNLTAEGQQFLVDDFAGYDVRHTVTRYHEFNVSGGDFAYSVEFEITDQPTDEGWLARLPVVGGLYSGANAVSQILAWIGSIIYFIFGTIWQITFNLVGMLYDVVVYAASMIGWLVTTYADIISGAQGWAVIFVTLPGILLGLELAKLIMIGISLLPTT